MSDFVKKLESEVEDSPWLSDMFQWGEELMDDVVYPLLEDAKMEDLTSVGQAGLQMGSHALNSVASGLAGLGHGAMQVSAGVPPREAMANVGGFVDSLTNPNNSLYAPLTPTYTAPQGSGGESVMQGIGTLVKPLAEAGPALGNKVFEATGNPELATLGHVAPDAALGALGLSRNLRNTVVPYTGRHMKLYGADPQLPAPPRAPVPNALDSPLGAFKRSQKGRKQEGAIKVENPRGDTTGEIFGTDRLARVLPAYRSSAKVNDVQTSMFPVAKINQPVVREALSKLDAKIGKKGTRPAAWWREELNKLGVKPEELEAFGVTGILAEAEAYGQDEGGEEAELGVGDIEAIGLKDFEMNITTGGSDTMPPKGSLHEAKDPQLQALEDNLTLSGRHLQNTFRGGPRPEGFFEIDGRYPDRESQLGLWAVLNSAFRRMPDLDPENDSHTEVNLAQVKRDLQSQLQNLVTMRGSKGEMDIPQYIGKVDQMFDTFVYNLIPERMVDPELQDDIAEFKEDYLNAASANLYFRDQIGLENKRVGDGWSDDQEKYTSQANVSDALASSGYQTQLKNSGSLSDSVSVFGFPQNVYGERDLTAQHFPAPQGQISAGHVREGRYLLHDPDIDYSRLQQGQSLETATHGSEFQDDFHRSAGSEHSQYSYGRDLNAMERVGLQQAENRRQELLDRIKDSHKERDQKADEFEALAQSEEGRTRDVQGEYEAYAKDWEARSDAMHKELEAVRKTIEGDKETEKGQMADLPFKSKVDQTVRAIKLLIHNAAIRGDEYVTLPSRMETGRHQGSGDMEYVEDAIWNGDKWVPSNRMYGYDEIPYVELEPYLPEEYRRGRTGKDSKGRPIALKPDLQTEDDMAVEWFLERMEVDDDLGKQLLEAHYNDTLIDYMHVYRVPDHMLAKAGVQEALAKDGYDGWTPESYQVDEMADIVATVLGRPEDHRDIADEIRGTEEYGLFIERDTDDGQPLTTDEHGDFDEWIEDEATILVKNGAWTKDNIQDVMGGEDLWFEYLENNAPSVSIHDDLILDSGVAGAASNYNEDRVLIPAVKRVMAEYGEPEYEPIHKDIITTDDFTRDVDEYNDGQDVSTHLAIKMTPNLIEKSQGASTMFGGLNKLRTREERRRDSMERRKEKPESYLYKNREYPEPALELDTQYDEGDDFNWMAKDLPSGDAGAQRVKSMARAQGLYPAGRLEGLPETTWVPERGETEYGNFQPAVDIAKKYTEGAGRAYTPPQEYSAVSPRRAKAMAHEYEIMPDTRNEPETKASYAALGTETMDQFEMLLDSGLKVDFNYNYEQLRDVLDDVIDNNHMSIFSTADGYGEGGVDTMLADADNPMLQPTRFTTSDGQPMLLNDVFRVVHDYFGHVKNGVGFRARGEEAAWQAHASMYSPLARRAMTSETRGQNSWVNFGPHAEFNKTADGENTKYAEQKIGLMPNWVSEEGRLSATDRRQRFDALVQSNSTGFEGAIGDDGLLSITHYSRVPFSRTDPQKWGKGLSRTVRSEMGREKIAPPRTYFGVIKAETNPYKKEVGLGDIVNETRVDPELIYDIKADPENLWQIDRGDLSVLAENEQRIKDAGYTGYFVSHPALGKVVAVFDEVQVGALSEK